MQPLTNPLPGYCEFLMLLNFQNTSQPWHGMALSIGHCIVSNHPKGGARYPLPQGNFPHIFSWCLHNFLMIWYSSIFSQFVVEFQGDWEKTKLCGMLWSLLFFEALPQILLMWLGSQYSSFSVLSLTIYRLRDVMFSQKIKLYLLKKNIYISWCLSPFKIWQHWRTVIL